MRLRFAVALFAVAVLVGIAPAHADLRVIISGGFSAAYRELLPIFERETGIKIETGSGSSQGTGPETIFAQLERGVPADVVILSGEGLEELVLARRIVAGTAVGLARSPLGAAVRAGNPKPSLQTVNDVRQALISARLIAIPASTSGIFIRDVILPKLKIVEAARIKLLPRGRDATAMLAAGEADMAMAPVSELVNVPGVDFVGALPDQLQLVQTFTAAVVEGSTQQEQAKRLIAFLSSSRAAAYIRRAGMEPDPQPRK